MSREFGTLPEWLTEEELDKMIWATVHKYYNKNYSEFATWITKEDIYMQIQIDIRTLVWQTHNFKDLKTAIVNDFKTIQQQYLWRSKYHGMSLDTPVHTNQSDDEDNKMTFMDTMHDESSSVDSTDRLLIDNVLSIKNKDVRSAIICIAYLYCNIDAFRSAYLELLKVSDEKVKMSLQELEEVIKTNENIDRAREDNEKINARKKPLKVVNIIQALMISEYEKEKDIMVKQKQEIESLSVRANRFLEDLQEYLVLCDVI